MKELFWQAKNLELASLFLLRRQGKMRYPQPLRKEPADRFRRDHISPLSRVLQHITWDIPKVTSFPWCSMLERQLFQAVPLLLCTYNLGSMWLNVSMLTDGKLTWERAQVRTPGIWSYVVHSSSNNSVIILWQQFLTC